MKLNLLLLCCCLLTTFLNAQQNLNNTFTGCGADWLRSQHPELEAVQTQFDKAAAIQSGQPHHFSMPPTRTLPVVVHIIHNGGPENISDALVMQGIDQLNAAFAAQFGTGVNTDIQFCLAQRTPEGLATNGITHTSSPLTNFDMDVQDIAVKDLIRWSPTCFINIWVVAAINSSSSGNGVVGYAYFPSAHGTPVDGIVMEAAYLGSSQANTSVLVHEMGHYLGLYHTFEGGCQNDDCQLQGDRVCDTPPDQTTFSGCNPNANSCDTDANDPSGNNPFSTDVADLGEDYMDYSDLSCYSRFTQGQSDRMNWHITNVRSSLLACLSCQTPCPAPVTASINTPSGNITVAIGNTVNFSAVAGNASGYSWNIGSNAPFATTLNTSYTFNTAGTFWVKFCAQSSDPAFCSPVCDSVQVIVVCGVNAAFIPLNEAVLQNTTVNFINQTTGATTYQWLLNGVSMSTAANWTYNFNTLGNQLVTLIAGNGLCSDTVSSLVPVITACTNASFQKDYDSGGEDAAYQMTTTPDGGYMMVGYRYDNPAYQGLLIKADALGNIVWSKMIATAVLSDIQRIPAGGYIITGTLNASNIICGGPTTTQSLLILRIDESGNITWKKTMNCNTTSGERGLSIRPTSDGGFVFSGNRDLACSIADVLIGKLAADGSLLWSKYYYNPSTDTGIVINEDNDGNLVVVGYSRQINWHDGFVMKLDNANGNIIWSKFYDCVAPSLPSGNDDAFNSFVVKSNGNYIVGGRTYGLYDWSSLAGTPKTFLTEIDKNNGNVIWEKYYAFQSSNQMQLSDFLYNPNNQQYILAAIDATNIPLVSAGSGASGIVSIDANSGNPINATYLTSGYIFNVELVGTDEYAISGYKGDWNSINKDIHLVKVNENLETVYCPQVHPEVTLVPGHSFNIFDAIWTVTDCGSCYQANPAVSISPIELTQNTAYCIDPCPTPICPEIPALTGNDTTICAGSSVVLQCVDGLDEYHWTPAVTLDNPDVQHPVATPTVTTTYTLNAVKLGYELILNGDFSAGNTGFSTGYSLSNYSPCHYTLNADNWFQASYPDHTPTADNQSFMADGCDIPGTLVWGQNGIAVSPNTDYRFSLWMTEGDIAPQQIQVKFNGVVQTLFAALPITNPVFYYNEYVYIWNSGSTTSLDIAMTDLELDGYGNDFSIDDISLRAYCHYTDSVTIVIHGNTSLVLDLGPDIASCSNAVHTFDAGDGFISYEWQNGSIDQTFTAFSPGKYWVTTWDSCGGIQSDTVMVTLEPTPTLDLGQDLVICGGESTQLSYTSDGTFTTFNWSPTTGLSCAHCPSPMVSVGDTTIYTLVATTADGCSNIDSISVLISSGLGSADTLLIGSCDPDDVGSFTNTYTNQFGCDSTITVITTLLSSNNQTINLSSCNPADTGVVVQSYINQFGCDSTITTITSLLPGNNLIINLMTCNPADTGIVINTFSNQFGCDSIVLIITALQPDIHQTINLTSCNPADTGIVVQTLTTPSGCDSTITTITTLLQSSMDTIFQASCNPLDTGAVTNNFTNQYGCDSSVTIITTYEPISTQTNMVTICQGEDYSFNGNIYTLTGIYRDTITDFQGCDSIFITDLSVLDTSFYLQEFIFCAGDSFLVGNTYYTSPGEFTDILSAISGCDSTIVTRIIPGSTEYCDSLYYSIYIPNVFSPNADGINDYFQPYSPVSVFTEMLIFDRWGELVYKSDPTNGNAMKWDGYYRGKPLDTGVFAYYIKGISGNGNGFIKKGDLTLVR